MDTKPLSFKVFSFNNPRRILVRNSIHVARTNVDPVIVDLSEHDGEYAAIEKTDLVGPAQRHGPHAYVAIVSS